MIWTRILAAGMIIMFALYSLSVVYGLPSGGVYPPRFTLRQGDWYDSWGFNRNYAEGSDGYLPNIAYETLGTNKELAYGIGEQFKTKYPQKVGRAEAILSYVQRWTDYGYDEDHVYMSGVAQEEWAWNADEMAAMFDETTGDVAIGDCEDMAFLCATLYLAAGFDVALVSPPGHLALMIWLPEYDNPNYYWDLLDGRGGGWIWVEPTGEDNPLGWTPPDFTDGNFDVYQLGSIISNIKYIPQGPQADDEVIVTVSVATQGTPISQVRLHYSVNRGAFNTLVMTRQGSSYTGKIPKQAEEAVVEFYITAVNTAGIVSESSEFSYTVGGGIGLPDLEIPGFPFESIMLGMALGLLTMYFLQRKRSRLTIPGTSR